MEYLEKEIQKYYANEITLEELKKVLHFIIDDVVVPDAIYTKKKIDENLGPITIEDFGFEED